jgi:antitoxin (DNA-binding transcriptional repressor) of toxin-antitoxin stability system
MQIELQPGNAVHASLMAAAQSGEEVVLASDGRPVVKLVVVPLAPHPGSRTPGRLRGKLQLPPDWAQKFDAMDEEIASLMLDAPLTTKGDI